MATFYRGGMLPRHPRTYFVRGACDTTFLPNGAFPTGHQKTMNFGRIPLKSRAFRGSIMKTKPVMEWITAVVITDRAGNFTKPECGYGVAFAPTALEEIAIRDDFSHLRGKLEAKWEKVAKVLTLYVREKGRA